METRRKTIRLQNKTTEQIEKVVLVQEDSKQGYWCIVLADKHQDWVWFPHEDWKKIK